MRIVKKILIIKTSSMGDVIHAFPAMTDLLRVQPDAQIDWVVESAFAGIVRLHPGVRNVIQSDVRKWRKAVLSAPVRAAFSTFRANVRQTRYDLIVDLQGLVKSALLAKLAQGTRIGYDGASAREPLAALLYQRKFRVSRELHAVDRNRALLAAACGYPIPAAQNSGLAMHAITQRLVVCCHATSRDDKLWPEAHWREVIAHCEQRGFAVGLPWGNAAEEARAHRLAAGFAHAKVWPRDPFAVLAQQLAEATCVIGVDTGVLHLAAAVGVPVVGIYVATSPALSGAWGGQAPAINLGGVGITPRVSDVLDTIAPWLD